MRSIDIHSHIEVPEVTQWSREIKVRGQGPGKRNWVPKESRSAHGAHSDSISKKLRNPESRLADLDRMGIDIQVVSMNLPTPVYWARKELGGKIARICNDGVAEFVSKIPDRFVGLGSLPFQDIKGSVRELTYLTEKLDLRGVQGPSNVRNQDLGEKRFWPLWAEFEKLGVPLIIHPRGFTHDDRLHKFFLWNTIGQPLEESLAMASFVHSGVMDKFPDLKVVISHGGGYLPYYSGRGDRAFESRPEPGQNITRYPSEYLKHFFYDSVVFDPDMLSRLVSVAGPARVMMGTDYPRGETEEDPVGFLSSATLGAAEFDQIATLNAKKLFRIN